MIRVVVVDDEALVRSGFTMILQAAGDIRVVATATGADAEREIALARPDVVLLDIRMPGVDGLTVLDRVLAAGDAPAVAMLTTFDTDEYIEQALAAGASGFLLKDTDPDQLVQSVRALAAGAVVLSPGAARPVVGGRLSADRRAAERDVAALTDRERDVLALVSEGLSNAEIGRELYLSPSTVKDHVSTLLGKLGVTSRVRAALLAQLAGLRRPGDDA
ncbi:MULTISPECIES: response regulator transcription factor [unclassified Pseudonocardia]|uniref:response regulator n=1 Tax=unclassified Pseudonocardia TaxID=2619320 RepID=UPI001CF6E743|nr:MULTISPECIES: response regulator transcription factor [unclassified Pseudonocardia]